MSLRIMLADEETIKRFSGVLRVYDKSYASIVEIFFYLLTY